MEKIVDIFGYSALYGDMYSPDDSWFGRILLGEDNKFEGVVEDFYQTSFFLVFGHMTEDSIDLIKCSRMDTNMPYLFSVTKEEFKYYGDYYAKNLFAKVPLGECKLSILPAEVTREESDYEKNGLKNGIELLKKDLGKKGKELLVEFEKQREFTNKSNKTI